MLNAIGNVQMEAHHLYHDFRSIVPSRGPGGPEGEE